MDTNISTCSMLCRKMFSVVMSCTMVIAMATAVPTGTGTIPLDIDELERLGINPEDLMQHLRHLKDGNYVCGYREISDMRRHFLRNRTVTCNDGSPAGLVAAEHGTGTLKGRAI